MRSFDYCFNAQNIIMLLFKNTKINSINIVRNVDIIFKILLVINMVCLIVVPNSETTNRNIYWWAHFFQPRV